MKFIDFIYFISNKAYERGNKEKHGAFFINSLWFSSYQTILFYILFSILEILIGIQLFPNQTESVYLLLFGHIFIIINNIYLSIGDRKQKILNRFDISTKRAIVYWIVYSVSFFVFFFLGGYISFLKNDFF